jgi:Tol biopolymer transport system component
LVFFKTKTVILKYHFTKHQSSLMRQLLIILAFLSFMASRAQNARQPVSVTDMLKIKTINNVTLTEDGTLAAFVVTAIEPESDSARWDYKYTNQLWVISTEPGTAPRQLTFSKDGASQPAWSPDGKQLAFVRTADGKPQVFILSLAGGEPMQLTKSRYGASSPRWTSNGKQIIFSAAVKRFIDQSWKKGAFLVGGKAGLQSK